MEVGAGLGGIDVAVTAGDGSVVATLAGAVMTVAVGAVTGGVGRVVHAERKMAALAPTTRYCDTGLYIAFFLSGFSPLFGIFYPAFTDVNVLVKITCAQSSSIIRRRESVL